MKPEELRIGNYVTFEGSVGKIETIVLSLANTGAGIGSLSQSKEITVVAYNECLPVPLTEEWLLKFGFSKIDGEWCNGNVLVGEVEPDGYYFSGLTDGIVDLSFVHQLQNLAYVINGEDLVIC